MSNSVNVLRRCGLLALIAVVTLTSCQPSTAPVLPTATAPPTRTTLIPSSALSSTLPPESLKGVGIQVWHPWLEVESGLLEAQVAEFNKENKWGITVRASSRTNYTELYDDVTGALRGESRPQLAVALPEQIIYWNESGEVVDLQDYVSDSLYGLTTDEIADFVPSFWGDSTKGEARFAVPAEMAAHLLLYNQSWAQELGFDAAPKSVQEFREQACAAHAAMTADDDPGNDGMGGWLVRTDPLTFVSWLLAFGGGVMDGEGYRFLTPRNLEAATFIKVLYDDGCAWLPTGEGDGATSFAVRHALFVPAGLEELSSYGRAFAAAENPDTWTVLGFPGGEGPAIVSYGSSFVVLKSTPEQQLASWLFIRWLLATENQKRWVEATGLYPLRTSTLNALGQYSASHPQWGQAVTLIPEAQGQPPLASWRQVRVMIGDGFDAMFRSNTAAGRIAQILAIMDSTAADLVK